MEEGSDKVWKLTLRPGVNRALVKFGRALLPTP
jgi:hypothetical protein